MLNFFKRMMPSNNQFAAYPSNNPNPYMAYQNTPNSYGYSNNPNTYQYPNNPGSYDMSRLETEINELKRQNGELTKRVVRLENYLGIRSDTGNNFEKLY